MALSHVAILHFRADAQPSARSHATYEGTWNHALALAQVLRQLGHEVSLCDSVAGEKMALPAGAHYLWPILAHPAAAALVSPQLRALDVARVGPALEVIDELMDKGKTRAALARAGLPVPVSLALTSADLRAHRCASNHRLESLVGWPAVLRPNRGLTGCDNHALTDARVMDKIIDQHVAEFGLSEEWLLERAVQGRELQAIVAANEVIGWMEVVRHQGDIEGVEWICPPTLRSTQMAGLSHLARRAAQTVGLGQWLCRVDLLLSERHNEMVLEVEPFVSLAANEMLARLCRAHGRPIESLVAGLLAPTLARSHKTQWGLAATT